MNSDIGQYLNAAPFNAWTGLQMEPLLNALVGLAIIAAVVVSFFLLIIGGIKWITSGGDKENLASAQRTITAAVIGLAIVFLVWAIINLVKFFFGIETGTAGPPAQPTYPGHGPQPI